MKNNVFTSRMMRGAAQVAGPTIGGAILFTEAHHYGGMLYDHAREAYSKYSESGLQCSQVSSLSSDSTIAFIRDGSSNSAEVISQAEKLKSLLLRINTRSTNRDMTPISFENVEQTAKKLLHFINSSHKFGHDHGLDNIFPDKNLEQIKAVVREIIQGCKDCLPQESHLTRYAYVNDIPVLVKYVFRDSVYKISGFFVARASDIKDYFPPGGIK